MIQKNYEMVTKEGYGEWEELICNRYSHTHCECQKIHRLLPPPLQRRESPHRTLACSVVRLQMFLSGANLRHHFILSCNRESPLIFSDPSCCIPTGLFPWKIVFSIFALFLFLFFFLGEWVGVLVVLYPVHFNVLNLLLSPYLPASNVGNVAFIRIDKTTFRLHSLWLSVRPADYQCMQRLWLIFDGMWRSAKVVVSER
jgi:hypothetical protein